MLRPYSKLAKDTLEKSPEWRRWIRYFEDYCDYKSLSEHTIRYYRYKLVTLVTYLQQEECDAIPQNVTPQQIRRFLLNEAQRLSKCSARHAYIALNVFFKCLELDEVRLENPMHKVERPRMPRRIIPSFTSDQIDSLIRTVDEAKPMERAVIYFMLDTGARAAEVCGLHLKDIDFSQRCATVIRKGDREEYLYFSAGTARALQLYLAQRRLDPEDPLFYCDKGAPLTRWALRVTVSKLCKEAGITGVRTSPHTLRHTYATQAIKNGMDVFTLQRLMSHKDLSTTQQYVDLDQEHLRTAQDRFSLVMAIKRSRR